MSETEGLEPAAAKTELSREDLFQIALHDLKNPLTVLYGYVSLGQEDSYDNHQLNLALGEIFPYAQALREIVISTNKNLLEWIKKPSPKNKKKTVRFLARLREKTTRSLRGEEKSSLSKIRKKRNFLSSRWEKEAQTKSCLQLIVEELDYYLRELAVKLQEELTEKPILQDKDYQEAVPLIFKNVAGLRELVQDVPWLTAIDQLRPKWEKASPGKIIEEVVDSFGEGEKKHPLVLELPPDLKELNFLTDRKFFKRILINLISNAWRYSYDDQEPIEIFLAVKEGFLVVAVKDKGIGLRPEIVNNPQSLFALKTRLPEAKEHSQTGTGYGLFLSQKLARKMGGKITVASEGSGKGSTFAFCLPLELDKKPASR